jgi:hypothetical protein
MVIFEELWPLVIFTWSCIFSIVSSQIFILTAALMIMKVLHNFSYSSLLTLSLKVNISYKVKAMIQVTVNIIWCIWYAASTDSQVFFFILSFFEKIQNSNLRIYM